MPDIGFQAKLSVNDGTAGAQADMAIDVLITLPARDLGKAETTSHTQTHFYKQFIPTLIESKELKAETFFTPTAYTRLDALLTGRKVMTWIVSAPDVDGAGAGTPEKWQFSGFLSKLDEMVFEREGVMMNKFEVTVTGPWTLTAAVPAP